MTDTTVVGCSVCSVKAAVKNGLCTDCYNEQPLQFIVRDAVQAVLPDLQWQGIYSNGTRYFLLFVYPTLDQYDLDWVNKLKEKIGEVITPHKHHFLNVEVQYIHGQYEVRINYKQEPEMYEVLELTGNPKTSGVTKIRSLFTYEDTLLLFRHQVMAAMPKLIAEGWIIPQDDKWLPVLGEISHFVNQQSLGELVIDSWAAVDANKLELLRSKILWLAQQSIAAVNISQPHQTGYGYLVGRADMAQEILKIISDMGDRLDE